MKRCADGTNNEKSYQRRFSGGFQGLGRNSPMPLPVPVRYYVFHDPKIPYMSYAAAAQLREDEPVEVVPLRMHITECR